MGRKRRHAHPHRDESGVNARGPASKGSPNIGGSIEITLPDEADEEDIGARVQGRLDADIGTDSSLPPWLLVRIGRVAVLIGLVGLSVTLPCDWLSWSRLLVVTTGGILVWVVAASTVGARIFHGIALTGGLLLLLGLVKHGTGLPALLGPGPAGLFLGVKHSDPLRPESGVRSRWLGPSDPPIS